MPLPINNQNHKFMRGCLDITIFECLILYNELGAYDMLGMIYKKYGVLYSPGTLYPILFTMERSGYIQYRWFDGKKVYSITKEGLLYLHEKVKEFRVFYKKLNDALLTLQI
jgi:DNA-binding PadR family transcriptional regulator